MDKHNMAAHGGAHAEVAYDRSDLSARVVFTFLGALALAGALVYPVSRWMYHYWTHGAKTITAPGATILPQSNLVSVFPGPRLQPDPGGDLKAFREDQEDTLNSYGWVDPQAGIVHIPIDQAMKEIAQRGLPVHSPSGEAASGKAAAARPAQKMTKTAQP